MTHTRYTCDRCRREIETDRAMIAIETGSQRTFVDHDLCPTCAAALREWLATAPAPAERTMTPAR